MNLITIGLILIPALIGCLVCLLPSKKGAILSLITSVLIGVGSLFLAWNYYNMGGTLQLSSYSWLPMLGAEIRLGVDSMSVVSCLLTAVTGIIVFITILPDARDRPAYFYGFLLWTQAGLMGVFLAYDALLFYIFWEVVLLPVYFLTALFGYNNRIYTSFKFFIYTFLGSVCLLVGIAYIYLHTSTHSFSWEAFRQATLST